MLEMLLGPLADIFNLDRSIAQLWYDAVHARVRSYIGTWPVSKIPPVSILQKNNDIGGAKHLKRPQRFFIC